MRILEGRRVSIHNQNSDTMLSDQFSQKLKASGYEFNMLNIFNIPSTRKPIYGLNSGSPGVSYLFRPGVLSIFNFNYKVGISSHFRATIAYNFKY